MQIKDSSKVACPLKVTGTVTFQYKEKSPRRHAYRVLASARNTSGKDVLLVRIEFEGTGTGLFLMHLAHTEDYFFASRLLKPKGTLAIQSEGRHTTDPDIPDEDLPGTAGPVQAYVTFVQFADGSTWGDKSKGAEALLDRQQKMKDLEKFDQIDRDQGQKALMSSVARPADSEAPEMLKSYCTHGWDAECAERALQNILVVARRHEYDAGTSAYVLLAQP